MKKHTDFEVDIAGHYLSYLVNGDDSRLTKEEKRESVKQSAVPRGFKEVSYDDFHKVIGQLDVEVYSERNMTYFRMKYPRRLVGMTEGYASEHRFYALEWKERE